MQEKKVKSLFSDKLTEFRKSLRISQDEMAAKLQLTGDWPQRKYAHWESGRSEPPFEVIVKLAKMGMDLNWAFTGETKIDNTKSIDSEKKYCENCKRLEKELIQCEARLDFAKELLDRQHGGRGARPDDDNDQGRIAAPG